MLPSRRAPPNPAVSYTLQRFSLDNAADTRSNVGDVRHGHDEGSHGLPPRTYARWPPTIPVVTITAKHAAHAGVGQAHNVLFPPSGGGMDLGRSGTGMTGKITRKTVIHRLRRLRRLHR